MTDTPTSSRSNNPNGSSSSLGYSEIARKWSRASTNLLASGFVVVLAIALVRYVGPWWRQEQAPSSNEHLDETVGRGIATDGSHGVLSGFGDLTDSLREARLVGDREQAALRLRQLCRQSVRSRKVTSRKIGPAELRMLQRLQDDSPVDQQPGRWRMYELDGPAPLVAVVSWTAPDITRGKSSRPNPASPGILSWGIALPGLNSAWTLFVYPGSGDRFSTIPMFSDLELPAGTARTMSLSSENGSAMTAFSGAASIASCRRHFEQWCSKSGALQMAPWRKLGRQWLARFGNSDVGWVDVHLYEENQKLAGGFMSISGGSRRVDELSYQRGQEAVSQ